MRSEMFLLISLVASSFEVLICDLLPSARIALFFPVFSFPVLFGTLYFLAPALLIS